MQFDVITQAHRSQASYRGGGERRPTYRYTVKGEGVTGCYSFAVIGHRPKGLKIFEGWTSVSPTNARGVRILGRLGTCSSGKIESL